MHTFLLLYVIYLFEQLWLHGSQVLVEGEHHWVRGNAGTTRVHLVQTLHKHGDGVTDALGQGTPRHPSCSCLCQHWRLQAMKTNNFSD